MELMMVIHSIVNRSMVVVMLMLFVMMMDIDSRGWGCHFCLNQWTHGQFVVMLEVSSYTYTHTHAHANCTGLHFDLGWCRYWSNRCIIGSYEYASTSKPVSRCMYDGSVSWCLVWTWRTRNRELWTVVSWMTRNVESRSHSQHTHTYTRLTFGKQTRADKQHTVNTRHTGSAKHTHSHHTLIHSHLCVYARKQK